MKNYNQFLFVKESHEYYPETKKLWNGTKILTKEETKNILNTECSDYLNFNLNNIIVKRNHMSGIKYMYYDIKNYERKSKNTYNYYTLIINNDPSWKNYPKRKIIALYDDTNRAIRKFIDDRDVYAVIPFNNVNWGVCPRHDMWFSIKDTITLMEFNDELSDISRYLKVKIHDDNFENFKSDLKELDLKLKNLTGIQIIHLENYLLLIDKIKEFGGVYNYYVHLIDPNRNDFKLMNSKELYNDYSFNNKEVWTDGKCLMIQMSEYKEMIL